MARLFTSGFESQSVAAAVEFDTITGSPTISTTTFRSGAAALRVNPTAAAHYVQHDYADETTIHYFRAYVLIHTSASALTDIIALGDNADSYVARIRLATNDTLELWNDTAKQGSSSSALTKDTWYRVEISYLDSGALTITGVLNGSQFATGTCPGNGGNGRFRLGIITATTADVYFDDIAVNNSAAGTGQTSFPGAGSVVHMYPNAAGDNTQWQDSASATQGTSTSAAVDETIPNDATDYNKRTLNSPTTTPIDDFNVQSSASAGIGSGDTVSVIQVGVRAGALSTTSTGRSIKTRIKSAASGTTTASATTPVNVNGWTTHKAATPKVPQLTSYTDPTTGSAWTPTGTNSLDNMQIGYQADVSSVNEIRVTDIWAIVEYVPSAATTTSTTTSSSTTTTSTSTSSTTTTSTSSSTTTTSTSTSSSTTTTSTSTSTTTTSTSTTTTHSTSTTTTISTSTTTTSTSTSTTTTSTSSSTTSSTSTTTTLSPSNIGGRLWSSGFELGTLTDGVEITTNSGAALVTSPVRGGTYALRINPGIEVVQYIKKDIDVGIGLNLTYVRFYFRVATFPVSGFVDVFSFITGDLGPTSYLILNSDQTIQLLDNYTTGASSAKSSALSANQWYRVEILQDLTTLSSAVTTGRLEGAQFGTMTNDLSDSANRQIGLYVGTAAGFGGAQAIDVYFDDIAVNTNRGSVQNSWPGEGKIIHLNPNAAGDNTSWAVQPILTSNYVDVSEIPPDDATSYVSSLTLGNLDDYNLSNTPSDLDSGATINLVHVGARFRRGAVGGTDPQIALRIEASSGGTVEESATITLTDTNFQTNQVAAPHNYYHTLYNLPGSSTSAWTKTDLDAAQIGLHQLNTTAQFSHVTNEWLLVEYVPSPPVTTSTTTTTSTSTTTTSTSTSSTTTTSTSSSTTTTSTSTSTTTTSTSTSSSTTTTSTSTTTTHSTSTTTSTSSSTTTTSTSTSTTTTSTSTSTTTTSTSSTTSTSTTTTHSTSTTTTSTSTSSSTTTTSTSTSSTTTSTSSSTTTTSTSTTTTHSTSTTTSTSSSSSTTTTSTSSSTSTTTTSTSTSSSTSTTTTHSTSSSTSTTTTSTSSSSSTTTSTSTTITTTSTTTSTTTPPPSTTSTSSSTSSSTSTTTTHAFEFSVEVDTSAFIVEGTYEN